MVKFMKLCHAFNIIIYHDPINIFFCDKFHHIVIKKNLENGLKDFEL
jgi:hypothetical protein